MFGHVLAETNGNRLLVCSYMPTEGDCRSATDDGVHGINERRGDNQFFAEVLPELQNETKLHALTVRWEVRSFSVLLLPPTFWSRLLDLAKIILTASRHGNLFTFIFFAPLLSKSHSFFFIILST